MTTKNSSERKEITVRVHYPVTATGHIVLRRDSDWSADIEPGEISHDGQCFEFNYNFDDAFSYFKPVLIDNSTEHWAQGDNYLTLSHETTDRDVYPYFHEDGGCSACETEELSSADGSTGYDFRIFMPPGYMENTLKRYPVLYLQDGQNVFFASESFNGADWRIQETLTVLNAMNVIDKVIAVGIYPQDRERDYTFPGYDAYGQFVTQTLKSRIDTTLRTLDNADNTAIMGSSLGGVASLYMAWQWPDVFGMTACMSGTFGWRDNLAQRIAAEPRRDLKIYLDSGWPQDNYEVTRDLRALLSNRGYREGLDLLYFAFPGARHDEQAWALRSHIPFQFFFSKKYPPPTMPHD